MPESYRDQYFLELEQAAEKRIGQTMRVALLFLAVGVGAAILAAPVLQGIAQSYAERGAAGLDRISTGSVNKPTRYTVRKSVLNPYTEKICGLETQRLCEDQ